MIYKKKSFHNLAVLVIFLFSGLITVFAQTPEEIAQKALRSTVLLKMQRANGRLSLGSGFFIEGGLIATNYHVIKDAKRGTAKLVGQEKQFTIDGYVSLDKDRDLAILKVTDLLAPALPLGNSANIQVGEAVYAVGNPRGLEGTFSPGVISSIRPEGNPVIRGKVLQITAPISPGSSGGAVLNSRAQVIGIAVASIVDGQNLNFAIPSNYLEDLRKRSTTSELAKTFAEDTPSKAKGFLLDLFLLSTPVFVVIQLLPMAKVKGCSTAVGVAFVFGLLKSLLTGMLMFLLLPTVILLLGLSYIVINAFLLWFTNKLISGFEIQGFFKIFFVAVMISIVETFLRWLILA